MNATKRERVVVSVGGSLIVPEGIDTEFLKRFRELILRKAAKGYAFSIIAGGGSTAREYQEAARIVLGDLPRDDWTGSASMRLD